MAQKIARGQPITVGGFFPGPPPPPPPGARPGDPWILQPFDAALMANLFHRAAGGATAAQPAGAAHVAG